MQKSAVYGTKILVTFVAMMVLGAHIVILSSMEFIPFHFLPLGASLLVAAMLFSFINFSKRAIP